MHIPKIDNYCRCRDFFLLMLGCRSIDVGMHLVYVLSCFSFVVTVYTMTRLFNTAGHINTKLQLRKRYRLIVLE